MLKNYIKTSLRNLWKNKGFSSINIAGLAIGLSTCLLMLIYVIDELSYDRYNEHADRIYRLDGEIKFGNNHFIMASSPAPAGPALRQDYPEIERMVRFRNYGGLLIRKGGQNIQEDKVIYADSTLFDVFTLPMIAGDPHTALTAPHSVVITEKIAKKYFNSVAGALDRNLLVNDSINYKVTGVIADMPSQSHFNYDLFVSLIQSDESRSGEWLSYNFNTYILLRKGVDARKLEAKFGGMILKYIAPLLKTALRALIPKG